MKYINFVLYILLLLILITLFYNRMLKEHFIETVTEICNTRKKLDMENCLKDIPGEKGIVGEIGRSGRVGVDGKFGITGISGNNGLDAKYIGIVNFKDDVTDSILSTHKEPLNKREIDNKITNIKLLRGTHGDNARMNPITFTDENDNVISSQHIDNYDLSEIIVKLENGNKGNSGKNAICNEPGRRGVSGVRGINGLRGQNGEKGFNGKQGEIGDVIENPNFDMISLDTLCTTDNVCIDLNMFKGIYNDFIILETIINKENDYNTSIEQLSHTAIGIESNCPIKVQEQFTNMNDIKCDKYIENNNEYCTKIIKGDQGKIGNIGDNGYNGAVGINGIRGKKGFDGINGEQIPNIDFIDKNTNTLLGKYKSVDSNANTQNINLNNGEKGDPAYIPDLIFMSGDNIIARHEKTENNSNKNIEKIVIHLDNSKGKQGIDGQDGVCDLGDEGDNGPQGGIGYDGDSGDRGYDGENGEKGLSGPLDKNPSYVKVNAEKYCFANGLLSDICLDKILLSKLIDSRR